MMRIEVHELADTVGISKSAVHRKLTEGVHKLDVLCAHNRTKTALRGCFNLAFDDVTPSFCADL